MYPLHCILPSIYESPIAFDATGHRITSHHITSHITSHHIKHLKGTSYAYYYVAACFQTLLYCLHW